jgi:RecB family endonuclease NucS
MAGISPSEAELRDLLATQVDVLEPGLTFVDKEKYIPNTLGTRSFIDLLAHDREKRWVLIELKRSDTAAREAIHEVYKYVEAAKGHLRARDDEIRAIIASTNWRELLVPFSRFVKDSNINVKGLRIEVGSTRKQLSATEITPLAITAGRILSPWHEISLYRSEERLEEGITDQSII